MELHKLDTFGVLYHKFSDDDIAFLRDRISEIQQDFESAPNAEGRLVGHLSEQRGFREDTEMMDKIQNLVAPLLNLYNQQYPGYLAKYQILSDDRPLFLSDAWVNFMKKYEYNPVHNHSGLFSFVMWTQIPYTREDEANLSTVPSKAIKENKVTNGAFEIFYTNTMGSLDSSRLPLDKSYEGGILFFPSQFYHTVYPFYTSDDYRISVSGNFHLKV